MRRELEERLFSTFPRLYAERDPETSRMSDGFACGDGWFELVWDLSAKLEALGNPEVRAFQVKEKFGALRFYLGPGLIFVPGGGTVRFGQEREVDSRAREFIEAAEHASETVCETCGA